MCAKGIPAHAPRADSDNPGGAPRVLGAPVPHRPGRCARKGTQLPARPVDNEDDPESSPSRAKEITIMEIRKYGGGGSDPIDLTKANRDAIREGSPVPPATPAKPVADVPVSPKRIKNARATFQQNAYEQRIQNVRHHFETERARVQHARKVYEGPPSQDELSVSVSGQSLADTA